MFLHLLLIQTRSIDAKDKHYTVTKEVHRKVASANDIGAPLQGKLSRILVKEGDTIEKNTPLFTIEAMKMESTIVATKPGTIQAIVLSEGVLVQQDDVVLEVSG